MIKLWLFILTSMRNCINLIKSPMIITPLTEYQSIIIFNDILFKKYVIIIINVFIGEII